MNRLIHPTAAVTLLMAMAASCLAAAPQTVDIRLTARPGFSEEGIDLQTSRGLHNMYAFGVNADIRRAFHQARAGQCLRLTVNPDFDFTDANAIRRVEPIPCR